MFAELTYVYRYLASIYNKLLPDIVVMYRLCFARCWCVAVDRCVCVSIVLLHFIKNPTFAHTKKAKPKQKIKIYNRNNKRNSYRETLILLNNFGFLFILDLRARTHTTVK